MYTAETTNIWMRWKLGLLNTDHVLKNKVVQNLIEDNTKKFDLVVADHSDQEALFLFAHKFNCPLVTIGEFKLIEIYCSRCSCRIMHLKDFATLFYV